MRKLRLTLIAFFMLLSCAACGQQQGETKKTDLQFKAGSYTASAQGYNGEVTIEATFSENAITDIQIQEQKETAHVGDSAYPILIEDIIAANGTGVDGVSGATFTSIALKNAVNAAAEAAEASDLDTFKNNTVTHQAKDEITGTWDVVIVGAGGAGMMAAAQAAQNGDTVLIIEKNAEMGGNTLVSGGAYQSTFDAVVWDPENPDATSGEYNGETYEKVTNDSGRIDTLKTILDWSEEPFDGTVDEAHPFVAGDIALNAQRGVHE